MAKTVGIVQARMRSERLPGKILAPLCGRPLLALIATRLARARVDEWWLATTSDPADDVTEAWGFELGLRVYRGHATDVLSRFLSVADETGADWLVRITADNPFVDAALVDALVCARDALADAKQEETSAIEILRPRGGRPVGYGAELVRTEALRRASAAIPAHQFHHRVHVTSWLSANGRIESVALPSGWPERPSWRWTVDTYEDLAMARSAFRLFGSEAATIDYPAMVRLLDGVPEIAAMNEHIVQKKLEEG
jgi:spore coat polysaccharide biosynthesis protein SpsF